MIFKSKEIVGLDWGTKELKWAKISTQPSTGRLRLLTLETLAVPEDEKELHPLLKKFVTEKKWRGAPAAVGMKDESLYIRRLELPRMPEEDLKEAVRWQMRDVAEGSMDDYMIQYSIMKEEAQADVTRLTLLGYAVKKSVLANRSLLLKQAGLKPFFMEPTPVALAASLERVYPAAEAQWVGCVDIGWQQAAFLVIQDGRLHFVQPLAGVALSHLPADDPQYPPKLAMEIQRAIDSFSIAHKNEKIDRIFLAGGGAGISQLPDSLSTNLGIPTAVMNPLQGVEGANEFPEAAAKPYLYGIAVAMALVKT